MPLSYSSPAIQPRKPGVVTWFSVYCAVMALLYLGCAIGGVYLLAFEPDLGEEDVWVMGLILTTMGIPLFFLFVFAPFLPRAKWVWIFDLVLICLGLTSVCFCPICIPLLIFWIKAECRAWFGFAPLAHFSPPLGTYAR